MEAGKVMAVVVYSSPVILAKYILKEHVAPFCYALFVITFLFLVNYLIGILNSILSKGLEWKVVLEIVVLNMAWMLALSIPMAVLVATLMAFGRLSADNEVTALRALGVSPVKAMIPVLCVAALLTGALVWFNDQVLPEANFRAAALRNDIGRKKPAALIAPRRIIRDFEGYQLWMDRVDPETDVFYGVRVYQQEPGQGLRYTFADSASLSYTPDGANLLVNLHSGENHVIEPRNPNQYLRIRFREQTAAIHNVDAALKREERTYRTDREMSVGEMLEVVKTGRETLESLRAEFVTAMYDDMRALDAQLTADSARPLPPRVARIPWIEQVDLNPGVIAEARRLEFENKNYHLARYEARSEVARQEVSQYLVEIHKKFSIPFACLVFVLIGAPLGVMARRGGIGTGVIYSLAFFILYWVGMIRGEALADRLALAPWVAMWAPNLVVGSIGLWLAWRVAREKYVGTSSPWQRLATACKSLWRRVRGLPPAPPKTAVPA
jgi:lipopolysaccharide export system permease protein